MMLWLKKIWLFTKRVVFFFLSLLMFLVGISVAVMGFTEGSSNDPWWFPFMGIALGILAIALGVFMLRYIVFGSNKDVEEADINPGGDFF